MVPAPPGGGRSQSASGNRANTTRAPPHASADEEDAEGGPKTEKKAEKPRPASAAAVSDGAARPLPLGWEMTMSNGKVRML